MKYFKVKAEADQVRKNVNSTDFLIANELYTEKELQKFTSTGSVYTKNYFDIVEIPKNNTYKMFGARFSTNK